MNGCLADIKAWITSHVQIKLWSLIHAVFFNQVLLIVHKGGGGGGLKAPYVQNMILIK